jgi:hypothetical protein
VEAGREPKDNDDKPRKPTETHGPCPDLRGTCIKAPTVCLLSRVKPLSWGIPSPKATFGAHARRCARRALHVLKASATLLQYGEGFYTGPPQVVAGSLSFFGFSMFLVVVLGLPAGSPQPYFRVCGLVAVFLSTETSLFLPSVIHLKPALSFPFVGCIIVHGSSYLRRLHSCTAQVPHFDDSDQCV